MSAREDETSNLAGQQGVAADARGARGLGDRARGGSRLRRPAAVRGSPELVGAPSRAAEHQTLGPGAWRSRRGETPARRGAFAPRRTGERGEGFARNCEWW